MYAIFLFVRGSLPWSQVREGTRKHIARRILEKKKSWTAARLCQGLPHELEELASYCFGLEIDDEPDYQFLRDKLTTIVGQEDYAKFEWEEPGWTPTSQTTSLPSLIPQELCRPAIRRGDIVLLKILPEKSLDYEAPQLDQSFFPHTTFTGTELKFPYRPAVIRKVLIQKIGTTYFELDVYPLARHSSLEGLSRQRCRTFQPLKSIVESATGVQLFPQDLFVYRPTVLERFAIEYNQVGLFQHLFNLPRLILSNVGRNNMC